MVKKGASTLVAVFIILVISLLAVSWLQASNTSGSSVQRQLVEQSTIDSFNHEFESSKLFLSKGLSISTQKGSRETAVSSGRKWNEDEARYWYCDGSPQSPDKQTVRNSTANITEPYFREYIAQAHGIKNQRILDIGEPTCIEPGYNKNLDSPENNKFKVATDIEAINLSSMEGSLSRREQNITISSEASRNRYWYMYSTLKDWVNNEDLKDSVRDKMEEVPDSQKEETTACGSSPSACSYAPSYTCKQKTKQQLENKVNKGLRQEMNKLEQNQNYFNNENVSCNFFMNELTVGQDTVDYPGFAVSKNTNTFANPQSPPMKCKDDGMETRTVTPDCYNKTVNGKCLETETVTGSCEYDQEKGKEVCNEYKTCTKYEKKKEKVCPPSYEEPVCTTEMVEDPPECGTNYECITEWHLTYKAYLDYTLVCTDNKYSSIPKDNLENQQWRIDLSYKVQENDISGKQINCNDRVSSKSYPPTTLNSCSFSKSANICNTGEKTVE